MAQRPEHSVKMKASHRSKALSEIVAYFVAERTHNILMAHMASPDDETKADLEELPSLHLLTMQKFDDVTLDKAISTLQPIILEFDGWINGSLTSYLEAETNVADYHTDATVESKPDVTSYREHCLAQLPQLLKMREKAFKIIMDMA